MQYAAVLAALGAQHGEAAGADMGETKAYLDARLSGDEQTARTECDAAVNGVVRHMHQDNPELYHAYADHPDTAQHVQDYIFKTTYLDIKEQYGTVGDPDVPPEQWGHEADTQETSNPETGSADTPKAPKPPASAPKKLGQSLPEKNYRAFSRLFPDIASQKYTSIRLQARDTICP